MLNSKRRGQNLDDEAIEKIVEIIDGWSFKKLTWNSLIERIFLSSKVCYSRQALNNHTRIRDAFGLRKMTLRVGGEKLSSAVQSAEQQRIVRLEAENDRLKRENNNLLEQFNRWVYNGHLKQMDNRMREFMNTPLPQIRRDPSRSE